MKQYSCFYCEEISTEMEWNKATQENFTTPITPINKGINRLDKGYNCPKCKEYMDANHIVKVESTPLSMGSQYDLFVSSFLYLSKQVETMKNNEVPEIEAKEKELAQTKEDLERFEKVLIEAYENGESDDSYRVCSECNEIMSEGYCIESGDDYYCSDKCLEKNMSKEEYLELYDDGEGDSYYTSWD